MRVVASINGATGTGKTTLARKILKDHPRILLIDPAADASWTRAHGYWRATSLKAASNAIAQKYYSPWRIVIAPSAALCAETLDKASHLLFLYAEQSKRKVPTCIAIDEMAECYSQAQAQRRDLSGFQRVILQGRHADISIVGVTQRPQDVATRFRDNADRAFFFALHDAAAREAVLRKIGREHAAQYKAIAPKFQYLEWREGKITSGRVTK